LKRIIIGFAYCLWLSLHGPIAAQTSAHQRIGVEKPRFHELETTLAWTLQDASPTEESGSLNADFTYAYHDAFDLRLSVPLLFSLAQETGIIRYGLGDLVVTAGLPGKHGDWSLRGEIGIGLPTGTADEYAVREGALASGSGTFSVYAASSLSLLRDPVVLSIDLSGGTAFPKEVAGGLLWQSGTAQCAFSMLEAVNENVSWSIALVPALVFPEWYNGQWRSLAPDWTVGIAFQLIWFSDPFVVKSGIRLDDGSSPVMNGAGGGIIHW